MLSPSNSFRKKKKKNARASLRRNLSYLLSSLPHSDLLIAPGNERIAWIAGEAAHVDVVAFEEAASKGRDADALAEYAGDLLPTIYDEWTVRDRERLRSVYHDVLVRTVPDRPRRSRTRLPN